MGLPLRDDERRGLQPGLSLWLVAATKDIAQLLLCGGDNGGVNMSPGSSSSSASPPAAPRPAVEGLERPIPFLVAVALGFAGALAVLVELDFSATIFGEHAMRDRVAAAVSVSSAVAVFLRSSLSGLVARLVPPEPGRLSVLLRVPSSFGLFLAAGSLLGLATPYLAMGAIMAPARALGAAYLLAALVLGAASAIYALHLLVACSWLRADERGVVRWSLLRGREVVREAWASKDNLLLATDKGTARIPLPGSRDEKSAIAVAQLLAARLRNS